MPLIQPPNDNWVHEPTSEDLEAQKELGIIISKLDNERIKNYLNVKSWKCPKCGLTNFGHNQKCADFKCKKEKT